MAALDKEGYLEWPGLLDAQGAKDLHSAILATREIGPSLFLSEAEWEASPKSHARTNPGPGYNLLEKMEDKLDFIHHNPELNRALTALLGKGFKWYQKKLVCRLPATSIPGWLYARIKDKPANSFGAFIKPPYRDIGYFYDADLHQDIHDWPRWPHKEHRLLTLYAYLDDAGADDAPLHLLPGTHVLGATPFQHDVRRIPGTDDWLYRDGKGHEVTSRLKTITGKAGYAGIWHSCLLHGSRYIHSGKPRISLRYLVARSDDPAPCLLDEINRKITGPLYPEEDTTAGATARADGFWTMEHTDFTRLQS